MSLSLVTGPELNLNLVDSTTVLDLTVAETTIGLTVSGPPPAIDLTVQTPPSFVLEFQAGQGPAGIGLPAFGFTDQVLAKNSNTSGDAAWRTLTATLVGLGSVNNTSDMDKPVSTAQQAAIDAAKAYADGLVVGLWDDRGSFDASVNTYPTSGGSGLAGAIKKGDVWTISVLATSGPLLNYPLGTTVRAIVDSPTSSDWAVTSSGLVGTVTVANGGTGVTTLTGLVKGNGTSPFSAAVAGTDYVAPGSITSDGITMSTGKMLGRTTAATGAVEEITIGSGLSLSGGTLSASASSTLNGITAASGTATINNAENAIVWNWNGSTASRVGFTIGENAASTGGAGSQYLLSIGTQAGSTANPFRVQAKGYPVMNVLNTGAVIVAGMYGTGNSNGAGGELNLSGGNAGNVASANGGLIQLTAGAGSTTTTGGAGGAITLTAGTGGLAAAGGAITITTGSGGATGAAGNLNLNVGITYSGTEAALTSNASRIALGGSSSVSNTGGVAVGTSAAASGAKSLALGSALTGSTTASSGYSTAIGLNSSGNGSQAVTGSGAMALGGSYASGQDSFAAAIGNNTSTYGAQGSNSISVGFQAKATATGSTAIGYSAAATGAQAFALGQATASANYSFALGYGANSGVIGKYSYASGQTAVSGDSQLGAIVLRKQTTTATATVLTSDAGAASTTNQLILPNDSSYTFTGSMIARNTAADTDSKAWTFFGAIRRGVAAANTAFIGTPSINVVGSDGSAWTFTLTADTTNGGLAVTVTGEAAKTINWVCRIDTVEVTG